MDLIHEDDPTVSICHDVNWVSDAQELPISMEPGFKAAVYRESDTSYYAQIESNEDVLNSSGRGKFPNGIGLSVPAPASDEDIVKTLIACRAVSGFHEAMEWTKLDGQPVAVAHPEEGEFEMWGWLYGKMRDLLDEYAERYPSSSD